MAVVSGGTTLIDNGALDAAVPSGSLTLLSTQTASASATISFTSGIDSTYDEYVFKFINIHPATNDVTFQVNFRDGGTDYDATKTTTFFRAQHSEGGANGNLSYRTDDDLAQSTAAQPLTMDIGNANDESASGEMILYNPSSTTFVKHFISRTTNYHSSNIAIDCYLAGYANTTSSVNKDGTRREIR